MKILNFGSCNIDYVYSLEHFVRKSETVSAEKMATFIGGKGLNQSIAVKRSGAEVFHAGQVGEDGEMLKKALVEAGVNVTMLKTVSVPTGHAIIQVNSCGENCIIIFGGANQTIEKNYIDSVLEHFNSGDCIVLQNEINNLDYIIDSAFKKGMNVFLNPSPINEQIKQLDFNKVSTLILNEVEALDITGQKEPEKACEYFKANYPKLKVLLTLGSNGSVFFDCVSGEYIYQSTFSVEVKDTTSAGDTFTGYYVSGIQKGLSVKEAMRLASAASAIAVSKNGSSVSIPTIDEVNEKLSSLEEGTQFYIKQQKLKTAIEGYIESNLNSASLSELSKRLAYSVSYTAATVKRVTGKTFTELLEHYRQEKAALLLKTTDLPIEEIITSIGYNNKSFFRRKFLKAFGCTPFQYRTKQKGKNINVR